MSADISTFKSPISIDGPPSACVELCIYDNDGPEGYFKRLRFESSAEAIFCIMDHFTRDEIKSMNFTIINYWGVPLSGRDNYIIKALP